MGTASEALGNQGQAEAGLDAGLELLSQLEEVTFTQYQKWTFAIDGYVFWIPSSTTLTVKGSLHYATDRLQDEDQTIGSNHVLLTSEVEVTQFNTVDPQTMWIGSWPIAGGPPLDVAFAARGNYYVEADLWHYSGFAVYPALKAQIVGSAADLPIGPIVSNSLPIWMQFNAPAPVFPSFLVPDNYAPPYVVAHIESTESLAAAPYIGPWPGDIVPDSGSDPLHSLAYAALCRDHVKLTLYGFTNNMALSYLAGIIDASLDPNAGFGFGNSPYVEDEKRVQVELAALAQKKKIEILANYYQGSADAIARRLILSASIGQVGIIGGKPAFGYGSILSDKATMSGTGAVG